jgi:putative ABC transport system permease protein
VSTFSTAFPVLRAIAGGTWSDHPGRLVLAVLGIAFGVALGVAVHLVNSSAANEFDLAVRSLAGEADLLVRGPRSGFPDTLYPRIARLEGVRAASPAVEVEVQLAGRRETIKLLGLDPFRAGHVQPHLLAESRDALLDLIKGDGVLLSRAAADALRLQAGETLRLHAGTRVLALRVIEVLPAGATPQQLAVMDIAGAQLRLGYLGAIQRIDLKLEPGTDLERFRDTLSPLLPPGVLAVTPEAEAGRSASLTRAYRTNLDMLALVALLTGAFLVFSTQFLALLRRRAQLALLRVLGLTRGRMLRLLVAEGAIVGVAGSALGVALGYFLAQAAIERLGGDLGAGYFKSVTSGLNVSALALLGYFALGVVFAVLGAAAPAFEASRRPPALALRAGDEEAALHELRSPWPGVALLAAGAAVSQAPPVGELPVFGYVSVALILFGAMLVMPRFAEASLARLPALRYAPANLAAAQLQATSRQVAVSLAAILASFSLMVSMLIMTGSFRASLEAWLDRMLPADLYVRAGRIGESGYFTAAEQQRIATLPGVQAAIFVRSRNVLLRADRPPVTLLARPFANGRPQPDLPLEGREISPPPRAPPAAWLSEIAADLLRVSPGDTIELPLGGATHTFTVAGIWRDYARQNGAVVIERSLYTALTGDDRANEAALHLEKGARFDDVAARLREVFADPEGIEIASTRELKSISLSIFDRTFAITYALEVAAVLIGLFGVSASFSAQAHARRREFGVLRHIGVTRRQIGAMLAIEGLIVGGLGVAVGLALGWLVSLVLIHVINRQSFHWSMDMHMPWQALAVLGGVLVLSASLTAVVSGRRAMSDEVTRAVRDDW